MPTRDGGHLFLTCLIPVKRVGEGASAGAEGEGVPPSHRLREELALLPVAQQSPKTEAAGQESPFARCQRTHFLRLLVVDQPMFNGRQQTDPVVNALKSLLSFLPGIAPREISVPETHDVLGRPWLVLAADIDARDHEADGGLASWAEGLWRTSRAELEAIFRHCFGFEGVADGPGFARYLARCQLETTMSFNDYWEGRPPLTGVNLLTLGLGALALLLGVGVLVAEALGPLHLLWALPVALGLVALGAILWIDRVGARPFPPAPDSDLPSILKALYVQQWFALFVEQAQLMRPAERFDAFGRFLATVKPHALAAPTQKPGVVRSDWIYQEPPALGQVVRAPR
ncbi:hypothetical protein [Thermaurantiacus sp.]